MKKIKAIVSLILVLSMLLQPGGAGGAFAAGGLKDQVAISNLKLLRLNGDAFSGSSGPYVSYDGAFRLTLDWDASMYANTLKEGDYFDIFLQKELKFFKPDGNLTFELLDAEDKIVANVEVTDVLDSDGKKTGVKRIRSTFTDYVNDKYDIKGTMFFSASLDQKVVSNESQVLKVSLKTTIDTVALEQNLQIKPLTPINDELVAKWHSNKLENGSVRWTVRLNHKKGELEGAVINDELRVTSAVDTMAGIGYDAGSFELREVEMDEYGRTIKDLGTTKLSVGETADYKLEVTNLAVHGKASFTLTFKSKAYDGKQYRLYYSTTYPSNTKPYLKNSVQVDVDSIIKNVSSVFRNDLAGGTGQGNLKGKIMVVKKDSLSDSPISGVKFQIIDSLNNVVETLTTDSEGKAISGVYSDRAVLTVKETNPAPGYKVVSFEKVVKINEDGNNDGDIVVVTNDPITKKIVVKKIWNGGTLENAKVVLKLGGSEINNVTLSSSNNWTHEFEVRRYASGTTNEINYDVSEVVPEGYNVEYSTATDSDGNVTVTITNTKKQGTSGGSTTTTTSDATTPDTTAAADTTTGTNPETTTGTTSDSSQATTDSANTSATQSSTTTGGGMGGAGSSVTTVKVSVSKVWEGEAGDKAVVFLLAEGKVIDTVELNAGNGWQHTFTDLPEYDGATKIRYSVGEQSMSGYGTRIEILSPGVYRITNTRLETPINEDEEPFIWYSEDTPLGGTGGPELPYTATLPAELYYGIGLLVIALGVALRGIKK